MSTPVVVPSQLDLAPPAEVISYPNAPFIVIAVLCGVMLFTMLVVYLVNRTTV